MRTITKKELTEQIAGLLNEKRSTVRNVVQRFLDTVIDELAKGNRLELRDFGVFGVRTRKPRKARNPRTDQTVNVPARCCVKFKVGRNMKDRVQKGSTEIRAAKGERKAQPAAASEASPPATT